MKKRTLLKIAAAFIALEAASFGVLNFLDTVPNAKKHPVLPAYQAWDDATNTLALKPNTKLTYTKLTEELRKVGMTSTAAIIDIERTFLGIKEDTTGVEIDENGFRQTQLVKNPDATILVMGDSIAFGTLEGRSYPNYLQKTLNNTLPQLSIRVFNASVQGHTTKDGLDRLPSLNIKPDVAIIHLGVNDVYQTTPAAYGLPTFTLRALGRFIPQLNGMAGSGFLGALTKLRMQFYTPPGISNLAKIAKHFNDMGTKVVFITPMMLADTPQNTPDFSVEKIAQSLPHWTQNADILGLANNQFEKALEKAAPNLGADIVNAGDWLAITTENQHAFYDNVHLTSTGSKAFAEFLSNTLRNTIENAYQVKLQQAELNKAAE